MSCIKGTSNHIYQTGRHPRSPFLCQCLVWFELCFPVAHLAGLLPFLLHLPPPGLRFLLQSGIVAFNPIFFWRIGTSPG